jgi:transposase
MNKPVKVAVEAGGHSRWIHDTLKKLGIRVYIVNPDKVKLIAKNKKKTDKVDAIFLATLTKMNRDAGINGLAQPAHTPWLKKPACRMGVPGDRP